MSETPMSADHAVFPLAPCERQTEPAGCHAGASRIQAGWCKGCLGDGRRVLLDQGVPVTLGPEFARIQSWFELAPREVES